MSSRNRFRYFFILFLWAIIFCAGGCDWIYSKLQKEGAEEKALFGEINPLQPNERVAQVQALLKLYGYRIGIIDGKLGPNTREAIIQFQKDNELAVTRFVDQATWKQLNIFSESSLVVNGELNGKAVQTALKNAKCSPGKIDGRMGRRTQEAVKHFQKLKGLTADGKIGYQTLKYLQTYLPHPASSQNFKESNVKK